MEVALRETDASHWVYRGEGAVNLVLAYRGSSPLFVGKVLRIQKASRKVSQGSDQWMNDQECLIWKHNQDILSSPTKEIAQQMFVQNLIAPGLGSQHVDGGIRVLVSREFLESVEKNVLSQRPAWRVEAAKINTLCDNALLLSDHSLFPHSISKGEPCISVEIKPKCGFLPFSRFIAEENAIKKSVTRFRMHQILKLHQKEISQISEYDPLDLFSGSKEKILKAVKALFTTPQNNFRVFLNGSLIYGGLGGGTNSTNFMVGEALEDVLKCVIQADVGMRTESFLHLVSETISKSGVLDRLLELQKLDIFDVEGAIHAYYDIVSKPCTVCKDLGDDIASQRYTSLHSVPFDESSNIVRDYLIAATAKDCSLMISFAPRQDEDPASPYSSVYLKLTDQNFDYKAYFIDLDMKPLKKMEYYYELDQKIVRCYTEMVKHEPEKAARTEAYEATH